MSRQAIRLFALVLTVAAGVSSTAFHAEAATTSGAGRSIWLQWGHDAGHTFANLGETQLDPTVAAGPLSGYQLEIGLTDVGPPLVTGSSVFATSEAWDYDTGRLARFDLSTGQRIWRHDLTCSGSPVLSLRSILLEDDCSVSDPNYAEVLSMGDGSLRYDASGFLGLVDQGTAYLTNRGGVVYGYPWTITASDVATGQTEWQISTASNSDVEYPLLVAGDTLYVKHGDAIEALDTATGQTRWTKTSSATINVISAVPGALYVRWQLGDRQGFARWATSDGSTRWRVRTTESDSFATTPDVLYRTTPTALQAWSAADGSLLWSRTSYEHDNLGQPVYADGVIWATDTQNDLLASFDASNGDFIRDFYTAPADWIAVADARVFVPSPDGRIFVFDFSA